MADVTITIPTPIVPTSPATSFYVTIVNSSGVTVWDGYEDNTPFTVTGLSAGNYTCNVEYDSHITGWCFNVSACVCPVVTSATITEPSPGLYYLNIVFDITYVMPSRDCPFTIYYNDGFRRTPLLITSIAGFTTVVGTTATKTIFLASNHCSVSIADSEGCTCFSESLVFSCTAPAFPTVTPAIVSSGGHWYIELVFPNCGTTCHSFTVNYLQTNVNLRDSVPDAGTYNVVLDCGDTFPKTILIELDPGVTLSIDGVRSYMVQLTDCCGTTLPDEGPYYSEVEF